MIIFISDQEQRLLWKDNMGRKSNFQFLHYVFVLRLEAWFPSSSLHVFQYVFLSCSEMYCLQNLLKENDGPTAKLVSDQCTVLQFRLQHVTMFSLRACVIRGNWMVARIYYCILQRRIKHNKGIKNSHNSFSLSRLL